MPEWDTYSLQDFLLFAPRTYYRLLELHNAAWWPGQVAALLSGLGILLLLRRGRGRSALLLLAVLWLWVGWSFHLRRYAEINWAAPWFAGLFAAEAALLAVFAWMGKPGFRFGWRRPGALLAGFAVLAYPVLAPLAGRPWRQAEVFAIAPDPTALGTLGILALAGGSARWWLAPLPLLWCAVGGATLWAMESPEAWVLPPAAALGLLALAIGGRSGRRS